MKRCAAVMLAVLGSMAFAQTVDVPQERASALLERGNAALARAMESGTAEAAKQNALREAAASYGTVLSGGLDGPALRLNLAAAEAQLGDRGRAALHLRAAGRLAHERHDDSSSRAANAAFGALRPGEGEAWPPMILPTESRFALRAAESAGVTTLAGVFVGSWSIGWLLLGARAARVGARTPMLAIAGLLIAGALSGGLLVSASIADARADRLGVIVRDGATPRSGPGDAFDSVAGSASAGIDVRVISERDGWAKVALSSGVEAWLPIDAILRINATVE
jgi:hypothetical protein